MTRNLESRIERLEALANDPLTSFFHGLTCQFAASQNMSAPKRQHDADDALKQLAGYLPN
jgi:hypothetical protein